MLELRYVREHAAEIEEMLRKRNNPISLAELKALEEKRRGLQLEADGLKAVRNQGSERVAALKKEKQDASAVIQEMQTVSEKIKVLDTDLASIEQKVTDLLLWLPNIPHETVPVGPDAASNREERKWGTPRAFDFVPQSHWDIGAKLGILDLERAARESGNGFPLFLGAGARLERALINFMLDLHTREHGYTEVLPPLMITPESMQGAGLLPKFEQELYRCKDDDLFLIPTAEVSITNIHRQETLDGGRLPIRYVACTPSFRRESGSYGKDVRGLIRQHHFDKVELYQFTKPEESWAEHEKLTAAAERVLQLLELPYRTLTLSTGDMGFQSAKTYDLEVWLPSQNTYREISSCSNCTDFQARRAGIRFRRDKSSKPEFVHTLNGSGLAVGRTWIAVVENYQQADGGVLIPAALRPYMGGLERIAP